MAKKNIIKDTIASKKTNNIKVAIYYRLSSQGQKESLKVGGNGLRDQKVDGFISADLVDLFTVTDKGKLYYELYRGNDPDPYAGIIHSSHHRGYEYTSHEPAKPWLDPDSSSWKEVYFDKPQSFDEMLSYIVSLRAKREQVRDEYEAAYNKRLDEYKKTKATAVDAFLADPKARAEKHSAFGRGDTYYTIPGWDEDFHRKDDPVFQECQRREELDRQTEEGKKKVESARSLTA